MWAVTPENLKPEGGGYLKIEGGQDEKECLFCAETIKTKSINCKHCGSMLL